MAKNNQAQIDIQAEIARLRAENERLTATLAEREKTAGKLTLKLAEKGGLAVYGLQRFPLTLFAEQWTKLATIMPEIQTYIEKHGPKGDRMMSEKGEDYLAYCKRIGKAPKAAEEKNDEKSKDSF